MPQEGVKMIENLLKKKDLAGYAKLFFISVFTFCFGYFIISKVAAMEQQTLQIQLALVFVAITLVATLSLFWMAKSIYRILPDNSYINHFMYILVGTTACLLGVSIFTLLRSFIVF